MKTVLFCGGRGSRLRGYAHNSPKPLIPVHGIPIILRLMAHYSSVGVKDFMLLTGYKHHEFEKFFSVIHQKPYIDLFNTILGKDYGATSISSWNIQLIDTGEDACIGERLYSVKKELINEQYFFLNYGDAVSEVGILDSLRALKSSQAVCAFGVALPHHSVHWVSYSSHDNEKFGQVKSVLDSNALGMRVNAGFMCATSELFDFINEHEELVVQPFARLIERNKLSVYEIDDYWHPIDTLKDLSTVEKYLEKSGYDISLGLLVRSIYE